MKKLLLGLLLFPTSVFASDVTVTWEYLTPPTDLAGFRLKQEGKVICEFASPTVRTGVCTGVTLSDGKNNFTMIAYDQGGNVSSDSDPYVYDPPPGKVGRVMSFTIK